MTVFGWENLPRDVIVPLNIYFTYVILEDDPGDDPFLGHSHLMDSFTLDLLRGKGQLHPRFRSLFRFFPDLLRCYGRFSQLTMLKSTLELIQGFWIESLQFRGFPGSSDYPMFLRRLNGLGDFSGATLFPVVQFDEAGQFEDIATVIAQIEPIVSLVNDLFSFYKEASAEEICLVNNICITEGLGAEQVLRRVVDDSVSAVRKLTGVLESRQSTDVLKTVNDFVRGYIRWHLCDERYRMKELSTRCRGGSVNAVKFRRFHEIACRAGCVDLVDFHVL
jgi:trichodiene synthase